MPDGELPGILTLTDLNGKIETNEIETVLVVVSDVMGRILGQHVPAMYFLENVARYGLQLPARFFPELDEALTCRIQRDTLRQASWLSRSAIVFCSVQPERNAHSSFTTPRKLLAQQMATAAEMGLQVRVSAKINYCLFNESATMLRSRDYSRLGPLDAQLTPGDVTAANSAELVNDAARRTLRQAGVALAYTEPAGAPGQYLAATSLMDALGAADGLLLLKHCIKTVAGQTGASATFMAQPADELPTNTLTLQLSLWDTRGRRNMFSGELRDVSPAVSEEEAEDNSPASDLEPEFTIELDELPLDDGALELTGKELTQFVAACRTHLGHMLPFFVPTVNSFKRLRRLQASYDLEQLVQGGQATIARGGAYVQCSLAGADANPYLAIAALLAAGLDGLRNETSLEKGAGEEAQAATLAATLDVALANMQAAPVAARLFGQEAVEHLHESWQNERHLFQLSVTDWERRRYFEQA